MLFRLRGVGEEEAEEVRYVLTQLDIDFYETPADRWGVSMPGIWLPDNSRLQEARAAIDEYQKKRSIRVRQEHKQLKQNGQVDTFLGRVRHRPFMMVIFVIILAVLMYFFLMPFLYFAQD